MSLRRRDLLAAGAALALPACRGNRLPSNLVPDMPCLTPSYWTTWGIQRFGDTDPARWVAASRQGPAAADRLTEANLFGPQGWAHVLRAVHADLYLVLDAGWDLAPGQAAENAAGTFLVSESKFPSCPGSPGERLAKLSEKVKLLGWRGLGVRVAAEAYRSGGGFAARAADPEAFFRAQMRLAHQAGVRYWKVEAGPAVSLGLRRMLSTNAPAEAPDLVVENSLPFGPLNGAGQAGEPAEHGRFRTWEQGRKLDDALETLAFSRIFRTGDATPQLSIPTTLDRAADLLLRGGEQRANDCLLNCGGEVYMAAALGCTMAIERHPGWSDPTQSGYDPRLLRYRMTEASRAVRWQRIAPPWPVGYSKSDVDAHRLSDDWPLAGGSGVMQSAPARVGRNCELPKVSAAGTAPFVVASRHPNGATAVATLPRISSGRGFDFPEADVTLEVDDPVRPIGVFGRFSSLTLDLVGPPVQMRVLAQDLASDKAVDVTGRVNLAGSTLVIPGDLINRIGKSEDIRNDQSDPGLVLQIFQV